MGDVNSLTKEILNDWMRRQKPSWRETYLTDVATHTQVNWTRNTLELVERSMRKEGLPDEAIRRVLLRVILGEEWREEEKADG
jgi:hypothetical protein